MLITDLWITGQETTTTTLVSAFIQFLNNPQVMDTVQKELIKVTNGGSRQLSLRDKTETPYLNATIAEVQRHASILNINFWRINNEPTVIGGHPVDSGCLIASQLSALHTNEKIFENPEKFNPERFIRNENLMQQTIPFGIGKRSCLGESLARAELYLVKTFFDKLISKCIYFRSLETYYSAIILNLLGKCHPLEKPFRLALPRDAKPST